MSFYFDLTSIGKVYEAECINYHDSWLSGFFAVYDYWPLFLSFAFIGLTLEHREIFFCLVLKGTFINGLLNWGFREAIGQAGPEPSCSSSTQNPAYASDGLTFLFIILLCSSGLIYDVPIRWFKLSILWVGGPLALYTRVWLRFNTGLQLLAGCGFGLIEGVLYCLLLYYVFTYERIDRWFLRSTRFGRDYEDTKIQPRRPTVVFEQVPSAVNAKLGSMIGVQDTLLASMMVEKSQDAAIGPSHPPPPEDHHSELYRSAQPISNVAMEWIRQ